MKSIEKVGRTVDDAITEALIELGASTDEVEIEVISKGSKGLLGFGAKEARVKVTLKEVVLEEELEVKETMPEEIHIEESIITSETVDDSEDAVSASKEEVEQVIKNAEDFLNKLLKQMDIECIVKSEIVNDNRISISLEGKNMGIIIGKRGETLDAIQYLVNIVANKERKEYIKIMLDTENYRARREETLRRLAFKLSKKVQKSRKPIILEPMNPYDRRIIHSALQDSKFVKTHSEGKEPFRKVVITPSYHNRSYK
ncbi:MAG: protein jag [Cellulosilyticum sp.]|nr:protein jag [Cellulosilyticum sp.]